jgi:hypothetical protein
MCVIVVKPAGAACPTLETLKACWESNPDGAGLAMSERGSVFWRKGFMNFDDFAAYYAQEKLPQRVNQALVFHFRIGTHGLKDGGNTHPFPLSGDPATLRQLAGRASVTVAHNGVFRNTVKLPKVSDTGQFIADCVSDHTGEGDPDIVAFWNKNKDVVSWSRLAILMPKNVFRLLGSWHCADDSECFFSNASWKFKTYTPPVGGYRYAGGCGGYGGDYWDDTDYRDGWLGAKNKKGVELTGTERKNWLGATVLTGAPTQPQGNAATLAAAQAVISGAAAAAAKTQKIPNIAPTGVKVKAGKVWFVTKKEVTLSDGSKGVTYETSDKAAK